MINILQCLREFRERYIECATRGGRKYYFIGRLLKARLVRQTHRQKVWDMCWIWGGRKRLVFRRQWRTTTV